MPIPVEAIRAEVPDGMTDVPGSPLQLARRSLAYLITKLHVQVVLAHGRTIRGRKSEKSQPCSVAYHGKDARRALHVRRHESGPPLLIKDVVFDTKQRRSRMLGKNGDSRGSIEGDATSFESKMGRRMTNDC